MIRIGIAAIALAGAFAFDALGADLLACELRCLCRTASDRGITADSAVRESVGRATVVYQGRVITIDTVSPQVAALRPELGPTRGIARLVVEAAWKGDVGDTATLVLDRSTSCSYWLEDGERYVIFAYRGRDGELHIRQCNGTVKLSRADSTLVVLGDPLLRRSPK